MKNLGIRWKIALLMCVVVLLMVGVQLAYYPNKQLSELRESLTNKAVSVTNLIAHEIGPAMDFEDQKVIGEVLKAFSTDPDAVYATLYNAAGERVAEIGAEKVTERPPFEAVRASKVVMLEPVLHIFSPVASRSGNTGTLITGFSMVAIEKQRTDIWLTTILIGLVVTVLGALASIIFGRRLGMQLERIAQEVERITEGDLTRPALALGTTDEIGRLGSAFDRMVQNQRQLVGQIAKVALQLNTQVGEFLATAQAQARGATEQSSAVEQTRRTLESLLNSGREIARTSQLVLENAERTQQNSGNMATRIVSLSKQLERISEILEVIKGIASKSEILALNAALEGTKAGEAGRGFSLVATQMQRLAENVMDAVRNIRDLTTDIREATQATVLATEETAKLSGDTTKSTRQIGHIIQQQQSGTEQVATAMDDVIRIATHTAAGSKQIVSASEETQQLVTALQDVVNRFRVMVN